MEQGRYYRARRYSLVAASARLATPTGAPMTNAELADETERLQKDGKWSEGAALMRENAAQIIAALRHSDPVLGECEECGHTIVTPLKRLPERQPSSDK